MKKELDQFVINIEFLLISVIQGVAIGAVASGATAMIAADKYTSLIYAFSGLLLILIFWSQAIMHVLGFIRWPLDMTHNFLYFITGFVEVIAFSVMSDPMRWFVFTAIFVGVSGLLYAYDLKMIVAAKPYLCKTKAGRSLYEDLYQLQMRDLVILVPLAILANGASAYMISAHPDIFIRHNYHYVLILFQIAFSLFVLADTMRSFKRRSVFIQKV